MERRKFVREFKLEAVKLVRERGVTVAQAAWDLGVHGNVLRRWVRECAADAQRAYPGQGQMKPDQLELERRRREVERREDDSGDASRRVDSDASVLSLPPAPQRMPTKLWAVVVGAPRR